jgi:hypothetical protein
VAQEILNQSEIEERWQSLAPVFIRGMQRSGTSVLVRALETVSFVGFPEGHLWFDLMEPIAWLRNPEYQRGQHLKQEGFALGEGRDVIFEKYIAWAIDRYHRDMLSLGTTRWFDKSPGSYAVKMLPILVELFPQSQIIFVYRNGITVVHSGLTLWSESDPDIFYGMCFGWARTMRTWRKLKGLLKGKYIELSQEKMAKEPYKVASMLTDFLRVPEHPERVAQFLYSNRENSAFPDRLPRDYQYQVDWSDEQKEHFVDVCGEEMKAWGYSINFDEPGGPTRAHPTPAESSIDNVRDYCAWLGIAQQDIALLTQERDDLKQERDQLLDWLERINQGRVMRVLNKADKLLRRLGLR